MSYKIISNTIIIFLITITTFSSFGQNKKTTEKYDKNTAIEKIEKIKHDTKYDTKVFTKLIKLTKKAKGNFDSFVYLAELDAKFAVSSKTNIEFAKIILDCTRLRPIFKDIAELMYLDIENFDVLKLARKVNGAKTNEDITILKNKIAYLKNKAKYKKLEDVPTR